MPLLDHFRAPLAPQRHWESFHVNWAGAIADLLNEQLLPEGYFAEERVHVGPRVEIDVVTLDLTPASTRNGAVALAAPAWAPPAAPLVVPAAFPDEFEVLVFAEEGGARLVAAVELVSPANKDRDAHRRAFAIKCASYLIGGIGLVLIDVVTTRQANLHNETMQLLGHDSKFNQPAGVSLYAVAYRPAVREQVEQIDVWPHELAIGGELPTVPLALNPEFCLPLDLEATYTAARQRRRLA